MTLATTVLDEFRLDYEKSNMDWAEHRLSIYGAFETFMRDTPNLVPGWQELVAGRTYENQTISVPVIQRATYSTSSSRSCTRETAENTSAYEDLSFTTLETGFQMLKAQYASNKIKYMQDFNRKMVDVQRTFLATLEAVAVANLNTNKSAVNNASGNPYTVASNIMLVPEEDNEQYFNELSQIMLQNDFGGLMYNVVASPRVSALVKFLNAQGGGNSTNLAFQFGDTNFAYTRSMTVPTGYRDTTYAMPEGSLGYTPWVDIDSQMGNVAGDGHEWFKQYLPILGHEVGVLYSSTCADKSGTLTGLDATLHESWQFSFDYDFINAYNSDTSTYPGTIFRADFSKT